MCGVASCAARHDRTNEPTGPNNRFKPRAKQRVLLCSEADYVRLVPNLCTLVCSEPKFVRIIKSIRSKLTGLVFSELIISLQTDVVGRPSYKTSTVLFATTIMSLHSNRA